MGFIFTDYETAQNWLHNGIPADVEQGGVLMNTQNPKHEDIELHLKGKAGRGLAIVVLSVPSECLTITVPGRGVISFDLLNFFSNPFRPFLDCSCIVRVMNVEDAEHEHSHELTLKNQKSQVFNPICAAVPGSDAPTIITPIHNLRELKIAFETIEAQQNLISDDGPYKLYAHYTNEGAVPHILKGGIRMSPTGQHDGGAYFGPRPQHFGYGVEPYAAYEMNLIKDCFGEERAHEYIGQHRLDIVIVYLCCEAALDTVQDRVNAHIVHKTYFEHFSKPDEQGDYYLPSAGIVGCYKMCEYVD